MESEELNQKTDFRVQSLGTETIEQGKAEISCTKFRLEGAGNFPAHYWVDDAGVLRQILIDERKVIQLQEGKEE